MRKFTSVAWDNLTWVAISMLLAITIWVAANMQDNPVEQNEVRAVTISVNLPTGFVVTSQPDQTTVTAVVRAARSEWALLGSSDILVTADLTNIHDPGTYRVTLEADIAPPLHGSVIALRPSTITLSLDREVEKRLPIKIVVTNDPPLGYTYPATLTCDESEVVVRGSAEAVDKVVQVEARINLADDLNPTTKVVSLTPVQDDGLRARDIKLTPATINCPVDIQVREDVTPVEVVPDRGGSFPPPGYTFEGYKDIQPSTVGVTGDKAAIEAMNRVVKTAPIDLTNRTETFTTEVDLRLPDNVTLVTESQTVRVTVIISPVLINREFQEIPVEITGLDRTQYRAAGIANTVTVNVAGPQANLLALAPEDIRVVANLSGLPAGNHQVKPQASILGQADTGLTITSILPEQLSVTIEALNPTTTPNPSTTPPPESTPTPVNNPSP